MHARQGVRALPCWRMMHAKVHLCMHMCMCMYICMCIYMGDA